MGCFASKKPDHASPQEEKPEEEDTDQLIEAIVQRIVGIRAKAEDYSAQLQVQVADIENSKLGILEEQPVRVNGIVTVGYEPESSTPEVPLLQAREGQEIEILVREMGGWSYCRRIGDKTPGWLPADRIAELAQLIADHEVGDAEGLLNLKLGDVVEVQMCYNVRHPPVMMFGHRCQLASSYCACIVRGTAPIPQKPE
ncbi:unnamed protein product [Symbiodinium natans]|uniref:SH3 domain-containing protein n=1 Tax=Symbiodinium natans TaxID=878477 RepID=A0A812U8R4_9DINO|nr:unnamed protein product [Symbiodinium natans]